ncbi:MAG: glutamate racemase [Clostridia bacterium]|nr:glutamate racemase [Clostridia bacterium]
MDRRDICVFDSGMGGLTCIRQLTELLPNETLRYFGDTGRVPYGNRSAEILLQYARQDVAFLKTFSPKAIVIACGTVSTTCLDLLRAENKGVPVLGVVGPASEKAAKVSKNGRIGVVGTRATIRTGAYEKAIRRLRPEAVFESKHCPLLVPLVEDGRVTEKDTVTKLMIREYFAPMKRAEVDTIVLGCTHYPLLTELIREEMGPDVTLIDTGREVALALKQLLEQKDALTDSAEEGNRYYYASDSATDFASLASVFLGCNIEGSVERIDIGKY